MKIMRETVIEVTNYFKKGGWVKYFLRKPSLPTACERCDAFRGSCLETRIMHLIPYYEEGKHDEFLCDDCYFEADANTTYPPIKG